MCACLLFNATDTFVAIIYSYVNYFLIILFFFYRSQTQKKDFQRRVPQAPSVDSLLLLDSIKTKDVLPTASQMMFNFSTEVTSTQTENSSLFKTSQTKKSQINPIPLKPKQGGKIVGIFSS